MSQNRCITLRSVLYQHGLFSAPALKSQLEVFPLQHRLRVCSPHTVVPCAKASWSTTHTEAAEKQPYYPQPPGAVTMTTGWLGDTALSLKGFGLCFLPSKIEAFQELVLHIKQDSLSLLPPTTYLQPGFPTVQTLEERAHALNSTLHSCIKRRGH